ncbi:hypothetical protein ACOZ32_10540 [Halobacterium sp. MBLA0001]|uniref:hypothetical protein n=1 Tax=Halobacterium sp. MBLA0001 TaxID=3413511 RepID=UPI003C719B17
MTQRVRWQRPLPGGEHATVTRVVGDHELPESGAETRRFRVDATADWVRARAAGGDVTRPAADAVSVSLPADAGLTRLRLTTPDGTTRLWLPGPAAAARIDAALDGDPTAARQLTAHAGGVAALAFAAGECLTQPGLCDLLDAVTAASDSAADDLHARRYGVLVGMLSTTAGPPMDTAADVRALCEGVDAIDAVGDVSVSAVVAEAMHRVTDTPRGARAFLADHGVEPRALADDSDGVFFAALLAHAATTRGLPAAKRCATRWPASKTFDAAKADAEAADYWARGDAWRSAVPTAADQSDAVFAYALANALYWTAEVDRGDSRIDELLFDGAVVAGREIDHDWIIGHSRFERARARAHRHRTSRTHALAIAAFTDAEAIADQWSFLDAWEPVYTRAIVASNMASARGDHHAAIGALDDGRAALSELAVPDARREEMYTHFDAQRHERRAILTDEPDQRRSHLEAARAQYDQLGFDRSVERIQEKLAAAPDHGDDATNGGVRDRQRAALATRQSLAGSDRGPALADIPALHDFLTETAPEAVGSPDPGVLPSERGGPPDDLPP